MALFYIYRYITLKAFMLSAVLLCLCLHAPVSNAFYIPGVAPTEYKNGELIGIRVSITSNVLVNKRV